MGLLMPTAKKPTTDATFSELFQQLEQQLSDNNSALNAAETQGCLVGFCCGGLPIDSPQWQPHLQQLLMENKALSIDLLKCLQRVQQRIYQQMHGDLFDLKLFIAEDNTAVSRRLASLSQWCEGWLLGFGLSQPEKSLSAEAKEGLADIRDISQVETALTVQDVDAFEKEMFEVVSHLKVIVEMIFLENQPMDKKVAIKLNSIPQSSTQIH